ncbi:MAG: hypothetical protein KAI81_07055, partial [Candidatus Marinimicrobia bacterium]|nr:hypothetical protein [Candidatus Neomarinimicrobiota bacterium]
EHFFAGCKNILVWNSDILSNINIHNLLNFHQHHQNDVSLAVRNRDSSRKLLFDKNNSLSGWRHKTENKEILVENKSGPFHEFAFSGIHLLKREFLDNFPPADHPYGLVKTWLDNASENTIAAFEHSEDYWFDCGKPETLNAANNFYKGRPK